MRRPPRRNERNPAPPAVIRVAGYARCSTEDQSARSDFNTLDNQKLLITRHVEQRAAVGDPVELAGFYIDDGFSGKNMERPELARLLNDIGAGQIQTVVVYKMDRITRSLRDFFQMDALMEGAGCSLVSVKEQFDTSTPMGRLLRTLLLAFAEMERETNGERVRDKMHTEARLGRFQGGQIPYGFDVVEKKLVPNEREAPVVRLIYEKYAETRSLSAVRDVLIAMGHRTRRREAKGRPVGGGNFTIQGIQNILQNPIYKGTYRFGSVEVEKSHEAIVTPSLFEVAQLIKASRQRPPTSKVPAGQERHAYLLQGLVECGNCGTRMTPYAMQRGPTLDRKKRYVAYYECGRSHKYPAGGKCPVARYNASRLEEAVLARLDTLAEGGKELHELLASVEARKEDAQARQRLEEVKAALDETRAKIANVLEAVAQGCGLTSIRKHLVELERREETLNLEALTLEATLRRDRTPLTLADVQRWFREIRDLLDVATPEERKRVMHGLVRRIESVDKETVRVTFNVLPEPPGGKPGMCLNQAWLPGVDSNHEPSG